MGDESFLQSGADGKRAAKRARVLLSARLSTPELSVDARLRDLSRKGALVECRTTLPPGTEVMFERGDTRVPAHVAWSAQGRLGLQFHYQIDDGELLVHIGRRKEHPAPPPRYGRSALAPGMNARDLAAARAWSVAVGLTLPERGD